MELTRAINSDTTVPNLIARHPKLFAAAIFLVVFLAGLSAGPVIIVEVLGVGGNMFAPVFLFLPILGLSLIVCAFFAWWENFAITVLVTVVSSVLLLFTVGVLNGEHHAPHAQKLGISGVVCFLLVPLSIQLLSVILNTYKIIQLKNTGVTPWPQ